MRKIAAVTFDLWDTLIQERPGGSDKVAMLRIDGIASILSARGIVHTDEELESAYTETGEFLEMTWSKKRDMPVGDQVLFMLSSIDDKLASKLANKELTEIERIYSESILDNPPMLLPGASDVLRSVKEKEYRIGLISNTGRTPGSVLRILMGRMGILEYFDTTTFSNETLFRKPSEGMFRITLDKLKVIPKAAVHIGDDADSDIAGAKRIGMHAIQVAAVGRSQSRIADGHVKSLDQVVDRIDQL
jgi:putative hydrolase of the HAD superfamily